MRANAETVIVGKRVLLVPYLPSHVPRYHEWMSSAELLQLTASEPLTLEEEYAMQQTWLHDEDKLTFIVHARNDSGEIDVKNDLSPTDPVVQASPMIGDVNIFLKGNVPETSDHLSFQRPTSTEDDEEEPFEAEVEVMIAEPAYRRKGYALETLELMLQYATAAPVSFFRRSRLSRTPEDGATGNSDHLSLLNSPLKIPPSCLVVRISEINEPSIRLFEKLGFATTKRVAIFQEVEMRWFSEGKENGMVGSQEPFQE